MDTKYNYQLFAAHEIILTFLDQNNGLSSWTMSSCPSLCDIKWWSLPKN